MPFLCFWTKVHTVTVSLFNKRRENQKVNPLNLEKSTNMISPTIPFVFLQLFFRRKSDFCNEDTEKKHQRNFCRIFMTVWICSLLILIDTPAMEHKRPGKPWL